MANVWILAICFESDPTHIIETAILVDGGCVGWFGDSPKKLKHIAIAHRTQDDEIV